MNYDFALGIASREKSLYAVWEDCHGTVSYWEKENDAIDEALRIATIYAREAGEKEPIYYNDILESWSDVVGIRSLTINRRWQELNGGKWR